MEKQFVPYELAVKLKELGFYETCCGYYDHSIKELDTISSDVCERLCKHDTHIKAPTFSQAFRWFRENYRMFHEVFIDTEPTVDEPDKLEFTYIVLHMVGMEEMHTSKNKRFKNYEEAELECLKKLIELVEQSKS
jgi:hypothetical protein